MIWFIILKLWIRHNFSIYIKIYNLLLLLLCCCLTSINVFVAHIRVYLLATASFLCIKIQFSLISDWNQFNCISWSVQRSRELFGASWKNFSGIKIDSVSDSKIELLNSRENGGKNREKIWSKFDWTMKSILWWPKHFFWKILKFMKAQQ